MATPNQRAIAIIDALLNATSSASIRQRVSLAFGSPEAFLRVLRDVTTNQVKVYENLVAKEATQAAVDADFEETP